MSVTYYVALPFVRTEAAAPPVKETVKSAAPSAEDMRISRLHVLRQDFGQMPVPFGQDHGKLPTNG